MMMFLSITVLTALINFFLGLFVYSRNPRGPSNIYFALMTFSIAGWIITLFLYYVISDPLPLLFVGRLNFAIIAPLTYFFYRFVSVFPKETAKSSKVIFYSTSISTVIIVLLSMFTPLIDKEEIARGAERIVVYGDLWFVWNAVVLINFIIAIASLLIKIKRSNGIIRIQLLYLLIGFCICFITALVTNVILPTLNNFSLQQFGSLSTLFFTGFTTYAIVKHRLMNIRLVILKSVIYMVLISFVASIYVLFVYWFYHTIFNQPMNLSVTLYNLSLALVIAFTFNPFKKVVRRITEKIFYKKDYNSNRLLSELSTILATTLRLEDMAQNSLTELLGQMKIGKGAYYIFSKDGMYSTFSQGYTKDQLLDEQTARDFAKRGNIVIFDDEDLEVQEIARTYNIAIAQPLKVKGNTHGLLVLGEKLNGQIFFDEDIDLIGIFSSEASIAIENAKAYEEIKDFNVILKKEVESATEDLRVANKKLRELDRAKDEFISVASHELRTPLAIAKGYLWIILNEQSLSSTIKKRVSISLQSVEHVVDLVNDMLDVSRMETQKIKLSPENVNVKELVGEIFGGMDPIAQNNKIVLKIKGSQNVTLTTDKEKLTQVISNLVSNAIKFTPKGGVVSAEFSEKNDTITISIADTGIGIKKEDISKLFVKFGRLDTSYTAVSKTSGTGLGLYICKSIVELLGGKIAVISEPDHGSTFTISIPQKKAYNY